MNKIGNESPEAYRDAIRVGDRRMVARAITHLESSRSDHIILGQAILEELLPYSGGAIRVGITGAAGVGKSTFIETLGLQLIEQGRRVAVLAVDPSSPRSGGSILGDKTRMQKLAQSPSAFIRPSPAKGSRGGVANRTRDSILVCEAAGFDVVLVETVGTGQTEIVVSSIVDFFMLLMSPGAGDELQGIKKGVVELADMLVVNKADGENKAMAESTKRAYSNAIELIMPLSPSWKARVLTASALTGEGIEEVWEMVCEHRSKLLETGELQARRRDQALASMWDLVDDGLQQAFRNHPGVVAKIADMERDVLSFEETPAAAARALLSILNQS